MTDPSTPSTQATPPTPQASPSLLKTLNERSRRFMLIVGLGMLAAILGAVIAAPFAIRLQPWIAGAPKLVAVLVNVLIARFWLLGVLPLLGYGVGRAFRLTPLSLAFGAAASGEVFYLLLDVATAGLGSVVARPALLAARIATLAGGILLTLRATRAGVRAADRAQVAARRSVESRKDEYAEMMRLAEQTAERHAGAGEPATERVQVQGGAAGAPAEGQTQESAQAVVQTSEQATELAQPVLETRAAATPTMHTSEQPGDDVESKSRRGIGKD